MEFQPYEQIIIKEMEEGCYKNMTGDIIEKLCIIGNIDLLNKIYDYNFDNSDFEFHDFNGNVKIIIKNWINNTVFVEDVYNKMVATTTMKYGTMRTFKFGFEKEIMSQNELISLLFKLCSYSIFILDYVEITKFFIKTEITQENVDILCFKNNIILKGVDGYKWLTMTYPYLNFYKGIYDYDSHYVNEICKLDYKIENIKTQISEIARDNVRDVVDPKGLEIEIKNDFKRQIANLDYNIKKNVVTELCKINDAVVEIKNDFMKHISIIEKDTDAILKYEVNALDDRIDKIQNNYINQIMNLENKMQQMFIFSFMMFIIFVIFLYK